MEKPIKRDQPESAEVGYRNPPEHTRFKPGKSGNPRGRPRGTQNMATILERTLREKVVINEHGRRKTISKLEAAFKQLANKAASGDLRALQLLAALVRSAEERAAKTPTTSSSFAEADEKVFLDILKRLDTTVKSEEGEANGPLK